MRGDYPSSTDGTYPVITHLASIYVQDPGTGYSNSDEVVITPSEGAELQLLSLNWELSNLLESQRRERDLKSNQLLTSDLEVVLVLNFLLNLA